MVGSKAICVEEVGPEELDWNLVHSEVVGTEMAGARGRWIFLELPAWVPGVSGCYMIGLGGGLVHGINP